MLLLFLCLITKIFDHLFGHKNIRTKTLPYVPSVLMSHHKVSVVLKMLPTFTKSVIRATKPYLARAK